MTLSKTAKRRVSVKKYVSTKRGHIGKIMATAKRRARQKGLDFDLDLDYLEQIAVDECPIFKTKFVWGRNQGRDNMSDKPSLDRIIPKLGYVKHNVAFISLNANRIKQDVEEKELYAVADWLHEARKEVLKNVKQKSTTSVSTKHRQQSQKRT